MERYRKIVCKAQLLIRLLVVFPIIIYRYVISPFFLPRCRFYPSCSRYAIDSVMRFGALYGIFLTFKRLLKCHPCHKGGYDPVPEIKIEGL